MKKIKNKKQHLKNQKRKNRQAVKAKERVERFSKIKLKRKAKRDEDKRAENETAKMQREIEKIQNRGTQIRKED